MNEDIVVLNGKDNDTVTWNPANSAPKRSPGKIALLPSASTLCPGPKYCALSGPRIDMAFTFSHFTPSCPMRLFAFALCCLFFVSPVFSLDAVYVSPSGKDTNSGLSDKEPVASIAKGLEVVKSKGFKWLILLEGVHRIEQPIVLTPEYSGLSVKGPGTISGARAITGWKPYKDGIWQAEIPAAKDGKWSFRQIYVNGELRHRAKTPNEGFYRVAACPEGTPGTTGNYHKDCQTFEFKPGDIRPDWKNLDDVEVVVYYFWIDNYLPIESVNTETNIVKFKYKGDMTFTDDFSEDGARYIVENVFEALDAPGEWYLDKPAGILYYMPKDGEEMSKIDVVAPFATELLRIEGNPMEGKFVEGVEFLDVSFQHCNFLFPPGKTNCPQGASDVSAAINMIGAKECAFEKCTFSNIGTYAIEMKNGCSGNVIAKCLFHNLSAGGIRIDGGAAGSPPLIHSKNNRIFDNEISYYGQNYHSANGILIKHSYGNYIARNHIHYGYQLGVSLGWNWGYGRSIARDNIVEDNHIHHIGQGLLSDMGGIYTLGPSPGTIIRNNLIHDIDANNYGGWGIYNDEGSTGILIENNIVYNTKFAGYDIHYAKEITVRNNIFALGRLEQLSRTRGEDHPSVYFENNIVYWKEGSLFSGDWNDRQYKYYIHPAKPEGYDFHRNFESNWNIFYNPNKKLEEIGFPGGKFVDWQKRGYDQNSIYADPMFVDPDNFDFRLKPESPALQRGFEPIDLSAVPGLMP